MGLSRPTDSSELTVDENRCKYGRRMGSAYTSKTQTYAVLKGRAKHFLSRVSVTPVPGRAWSITAPGRVAAPSHQSSGTSCAALANVATATDIARDDDETGGPTKAATARRTGRVVWRSGHACVGVCVCVCCRGKGAAFLRARTWWWRACVVVTTTTASLYPARLPYMTTQAERRRKSPRQTLCGKLSSQRQSPRPRPDCN